MKRRHWFHCTENYPGPEFIARRIIPPFAGSNEAPVPRLCVAETVARCFAARHFTSKVFVYRTEAPKRVIIPNYNQVPDVSLTGERWLIPPVKMILIDEIDGTYARQICFEFVQHVNKNLCASLLARCEMYAQAVRILPDKFKNKADARITAGLLPFLRQLEERKQNERRRKEETTGESRVPLA